MVTEVERQHRDDFRNRSYSEIYNDELDKLSKLVEITDENMIGYGYWLNCLRQGDSYFPHLSLSDGYFKLPEFNEYTEKTLLDVGIAVTKAYVLFYRDIMDNRYKIESYKPIISREWDESSIEQCYNTVLRNLPKLEKELVKLENLK